MSQFSAYKWIATDSTTGSGRQLVVNPAVNDVFHRLRGKELNFISVFGRARQGKSFLMNCLSGERELFRVSNEKDSCTQGIDMSDKWIDLPEFSRIDGGAPIMDKTKMKIGFLDAEGQGDRNVTYDATLVCPILVISKCVIFNWKGDLQKDHILETLGIMTKAAGNVSDSDEHVFSAATSGARGPKFGHLHVIFRDWQAANCDERAVYRTLFEKERIPDSSTRDRIRDEVLANFLSVQVWLFDAPTDSIADLRTRLTIDKTTAEFRGQVRNLRAVLAQQLSEPCYFAGQKITGSSIGMVVSGVANTLNEGSVVLPHSMFVNMMRIEVDKLRQVLEKSLQDGFNAFALDLQSQTSLEFIPTETELSNSIQLHFDDLLLRFKESVNEKVGETTVDMQLAIISDSFARAKQQADHLLSQFSTAYAASFAQWLLSTRVSLESQVSSKFNELFANERDTYSDIALADQFSMISNLVSYKLGIGRYPSTPALEDAFGIILRLFQSKCAEAESRNSANWEYLAQLEAEADLERERQARLQSINDSFETTVPMDMDQTTTDFNSPIYEEDDWDTFKDQKPKSAPLSAAEQLARARMFMGPTSRQPKGSKAGTVQKRIPIQQQLANASEWAISQNLRIDGKLYQGGDVLSSSSSSQSGTRTNDILGSSKSVQDATQAALLAQRRIADDAIKNLSRKPKK